MENNPLGQKTVYNPHYDSSLIFPIPRNVNRVKNNIDETLFDGYDIWNGYELSWLAKSGKPEVRRIQIIYSATSEFMVESKSLKLYLGSFIMTEMDSEEKVIEIITKDLSAALKTSVEVKLFKCDEKYDFTTFDTAQCIDYLPCECNVYSPDSSLLNVTQAATEEVCHSHLLKTNCPITGQPDWATVQIGYKGRFSIDKTSLLRYLVSYREHGDYHEACCEQIFKALYEVLRPEYLWVKCFFTRRGGIDINPCRFFGISPDRDFSTHLWRQ